jgi:hypothetical protein
MTRSVKNGAMDIKLAWKAHGCLIPSSVNSVPELSNITVAIQDVSGLDARLFGSRLNTGQGNVARELELDLYIKASSELALGTRMFLARIDYDALDHKGVLHRERLYTPIPVRVVGANVPIKGRSEPDTWSPWRLLLLPVGILEYLVEALTAQIC